MHNSAYNFILSVEIQHSRLLMLLHEQLHSANKHVQKVTGVTV